MSLAQLSFGRVRNKRFVNPLDGFVLPVWYGEVKHFAQIKHSFLHSTDRDLRTHREALYWIRGLKKFERPKGVCLLGTAFLQMNNSEMMCEVLD